MACNALLAIAIAHMTTGKSMEDFVGRFSTDRDSIKRYYDVPLSKKGLERLRKFDSEALASLAKIDFDALDQSGKVDYVLTQNFLDAEIRDERTRGDKQQQIKTLLPFADTIVGLEESRWVLDPLDPKTAAEKIESIRLQVMESEGKIRAGVEKKLTSASLAFRASKELASLQQTFGRWYSHYSGYKPTFTWWCQKPFEEASKVIDSLEKLLKEDIAGQKGQPEDPLVGEPIGRERLLNDLKREMIDETPEALIDIAEREYAWCLAEMLKCSIALGCGDDWKKALDKVKADHVEPGEQDDLIMQQGREAVKFVEDHDLVSLDDLVKETWRVNMLTAEQQKNWPFAFYGGQHMATSYPLPEMDHSTKVMSMKGNNKHFMRAVTHHELIPGHHLQGYMAERFRNYRQIFTTPFFIEGWALHWEMLLWDLNFPKSSEDKIGMLFWRMHRCARIVVSLKYHLGQMTEKEMIDFLVEKVGHERWTATSEVRRYIGDMYSPLYQCAYMIGGLQLRALYKELVPKKMTPREFHDAVLKLGSIPMSLVGASLTNVKLTRDYKSGGIIKLSYE